MTFKFPKKLSKAWIEAIERNGRVSSKFSGIKVVGLDPNFGCETRGESVGGLRNWIRGSAFTITENGTADSITVSVRSIGASNHVKCAIYKLSDLSLVKSTEQITLPNYGVWTNSWQTLNFAAPKPSLIGSAAYILVAWADTGNVNIHLTTSGGLGRAQQLTYNSFPDPLTPSSNAFLYSIYCSYTVLVVAPTVTTQDADSIGLD